MAEFEYPGVKSNKMALNCYLLRSPCTKLPTFFGRGHLKTIITNSLRHKQTNWFCWLDGTTNYISHIFRGESTSCQSQNVQIKYLFECNFENNYVISLSAPQQSGLFKIYWRFYSIWQWFSTRVSRRGVTSYHI